MLHESWFSLGWLFISLLLALQVVRRDFQHFEIHDAEIGALLLLGLGWNTVFGQGFLAALLGAVLVAVPNIVAWLATRHRREDRVWAAEGDLMLGGAVGAWVGIMGVPTTLILSLVPAFLLVLMGIPRVLAARRRVAARGGVEDPAAGFDPTSFNMIPMAPAVIAPAIVVVYGYIAGYPVLLFPLATWLSHWLR